MRRQPVHIRKRRSRTRSGDISDTQVAIGVGALMISLVFFALVLSYSSGEPEREVASTPSSVAVSAAPAPSSVGDAPSEPIRAAAKSEPAFGGGRGLAEPGTSRVRDAIDGKAAAGNDKIEMEPMEERYVSMGRKTSKDSGLPKAIRETLASACEPCRKAHFEAYREAMHAKRGASVLGRAKATKGIAIDAYREAFKRVRNRGAGERCCAHGDRWAR